MGYWAALAKVWRRNVLLLLVAIVLLVVTAGFWLGIPVYVVGSWLMYFEIPRWLSVGIIAVCICGLLSLYLLPFHTQVARAMGGNLLQQLWRIEWRFVFLTASFLFIFIQNIIIFS